MSEEQSEKKTQPIGYYDKRPEFGKKGPSRIRTHFTRGISYFLVIAAALIFYFLLLRLGEIGSAAKKVVGTLMPVVYGLAIAYVLNPVVMFVEGHISPVLKKKITKEGRAERIARTIGIFAGILLLVFIVVGLFNMIIPELYTSIRGLVVTLPAQITEVIDKINAMNTNDSTLGMFLANVMNQASESLQTWLRTDLMSQTNTLMTNLTAGVINVVSSVFDILIGLIISIYVLFSKEKFSSQCKKIVYALLKPTHANMVLHITQKSNEIFGGFISGKILDSAIIGVLCFAVLSLLHMPYTLLVSVIVGVTNVIPFFGPYIGAVPSALLILLEDPKMGVYFIIFILILQQIDGNIIGPKILGDSTGLSAFWVVFAILLGGGLFGIVGMILGVPTFAVIYYIADMIINHWLEKKNLPTDDDYYGQLSFVDEHGNFVHVETPEAGAQRETQISDELKAKLESLKKLEKEIEKEIENEKEKKEDK
ncbi:MAG: AI-2E family transporter [Hespellia sp.]|nr:AI-2E family transporter [Hespellia sp.]